MPTKEYKLKKINAAYLRALGLNVKGVLVGQGKIVVEWDSEPSEEDEQKVIGALQNQPIEITSLGSDKAILPIPFPETSEVKELPEMPTGEPLPQGSGSQQKTGAQKPAEE